MKIKLPLLKQQLVDGQVVSTETEAVFDIDTSVYSEERWEQNFPVLASHESLFQYIERVQANSLTARVQIACMLKAIYCFIESDSLSSYKEFAQMFNLAAPDYTERLITTLTEAFKAILNGSAVKN
jgi:hypothetical protein